MKKAIWLTVVGSILVQFAVLEWWHIRITDPVRSTDVSAAYRRLVDLPIEAAMADGAQVEFRVPDDTSWGRVRRVWGDYGFYVRAEGPQPGSGSGPYCLSELGVTAEGTVGGDPIEFGRTSVLNGQSTPCSARFLYFFAAPGQIARIRFRAKTDSRPGVHLVVQPYWRNNTKDQIAGIGVLEAWIRVVSFAAVAGCVLLLTAAGLFIRHQKSSLEVREDYLNRTD